MGAVKTILRIGIGSAAAAGLAAGAFFFWPTPPLTPAPIDTLGASADKGEYLATIGNCHTCHTSEGGAAYAGGLPFDTPFGRLYSTNITPDAETGIGGWSFEDFYRSMKQGMRPDGTHLYPAFPYTSFAGMADADIASIYLYLQTVAPVRSEPEANALKFPFGNRGLLKFWKKLFLDTSALTPDPTQSPEWNRGAYLVEGPGHCSACHTPRNLLGAERKSAAFAGGSYLDKVRTGDIRRWSAVNLTQSQDGLGAWSHEEIVSYLTTGQNARAVVHGPMNEVVVNSTQYLTPEDAAAMATYIKALPAKPAASGQKASAAQLAAGEIVYTVHCGTCHLPTGLGDATLGVPLGGNPIVQADDPASLINVLLYGPQLPPPPFVSDRTRMKPFGKRLSDEDIANVATYLRANFGNEAGPVSADEVKAQR